MSATALRQRTVDANGLAPAHHDGAAETGAGGPAREVLHASLRGVVAAAAMTGARAFTVNAGLVEEPPPRALVARSGLLRGVPPERRRAVVELVHWAYGAQGGALFGLLPESLRRRAWSGPVYGLVLWLGFEAVIAPGMGLEHAKRPRPAERLALAADHALYGFVLSEMRRRPQG